VNTVHYLNVVHTKAHSQLREQSAPPKRALISNLWSLVSLDDFKSRAPTHRGLRYRTQANRGVQPLADVYLPADAAAPLASVILVHGGSFVIGSRSMKPMRFLAAELVAAGFAVCAIDYRLVLRGGGLAEARRDVGDALTWWLAQAQRFSLDPEQISLVGLSAGAALSFFAAAEPGLAKPKRLVGVFGLYNYDFMNGLVANWLRQRITGAKEEGAWRQYTAMQAPQPVCDTLLLHGDADQVVPVSQTLELAARRQNLGLKTRTHIYPGAAHGFFNQRSGTADQALADILGFLNDE
jgi:acetyl esterase/lipase